MAWYNTDNKSNNIVISSRVRLARNINGYAFPVNLDDNNAKKLIEEIGKILVPNGFLRIDFEEIPPLTALSYVEKHYVSPEFANKTGPHTLFLNEPCNLAIMVNEEDHLRIQCIEPSISLEQAYKNACDIEELIDSKLEIAFDEKLGYLTQCPTNLGTGMRASVMVFLPALTMSGLMGRVSAELSKVGLTVRGMYGEGSKANGSIYQISNQICLGITEEEIIKKLNDAVSQVENLEKQACEKISPKQMDQLKDEIYRAIGTLKYAWLLSSSEFIKLYSYAHLGINMGLTDEVSVDRLNPLLVEAMPATLTLSSKTDINNDTDRDRARAQLVHETLFQK